MENQVNEPQVDKPQISKDDQPHVNGHEKEIERFQSFIAAYGIYHNMFAEPPERFEGFSVSLAKRLVQEMDQGMDDAEDFVKILNHESVTSLETLCEHYVQYHGIDLEKLKQQ